MLKNLFKTKEAKRRDAIKDLEDRKSSLLKKLVSLIKIAITAVGKKG